MNRDSGGWLRTAFGVGILGLVLTEVASVYFIMPMPGSQQMPSIDAPTRCMAGAGRCARHSVRWC